MSENVNSDTKTFDITLQLQFRDIKKLRYSTYSFAIAAHVKSRWEITKVTQVMKEKKQ